MSKNAKRAYVSALSALGVIILLFGIFTPLSFWVGLIIAIACWIASGILGTYWGIKKEKKGED
jgi:hypothetical protein